MHRSAVLSVEGGIEKKTLPRGAAGEAIAGAGAGAHDVAIVAGAVAGAAIETGTMVATGIGMMRDTTSGSADGSADRRIMTGMLVTTYCVQL